MQCRVLVENPVFWRPGRCSLTHKTNPNIITDWGLTLAESIDYDFWFRCRFSAFWSQLTPQAVSELLSSRESCVLRMCSHLFFYFARLFGAEVCIRLFPQDCQNHRLLNRGMRCWKRINKFSSHSRRFECCRWLVWIGFYWQYSRSSYRSKLPLFLPSSEH